MSFPYRTKDVDHLLRIKDEQIKKLKKKLDNKDRNQERLKYIKSHIVDFCAAIVFIFLIIIIIAAFVTDCTHGPSIEECTTKFEQSNTSCDAGSIKRSNWQDCCFCRSYGHKIIIPTTTP